METYCVKCRKKTATDNINEITTKSNRKAITGACNICHSKKYMFVSNVDGSSIDIHKIIGKIPRPTKGFVVPGYKCLGPYNPLDKQVSFDEKTGEIHKIHVQPKNKIDEIAMNHDICYSVNPSNKDDCDRKMVQSVDEMLYKDVNKTAMLARTIINKKTTIGIRSQTKKRHRNRQNKII